LSPGSSGSPTNIFNTSDQRYAALFRKYDETGDRERFILPARRGTGNFRLELGSRLDWQCYQLWVMGIGFMRFSYQGCCLYKVSPPVFGSSMTFFYLRGTRPAGFDPLQTFRDD
jgi:hypothetical protein